MTQLADLSKAIVDAKRAVAERKTSSQSVRDDAPLRGLRKTLKRLQRRRRADAARRVRLTAKMATKTTATTEQAKAG